MRRKHPGVHVEIAMALSAELVERVGRRRLDAAVVSELSKVPSGLLWSPFVREPLVLIAPPDAPDRPAGELLASYPFIRYTRQAWVGRLIHATMKRRRIKVAEAMTLDTLEAVTAMVSRGLGVSIVPDRGHGVAFAFPVRTVALPGPTVHRVVGLLRPDRPCQGILGGRAARRAGNGRRPRLRRQPPHSIKKIEEMNDLYSLLLNLVSC